MEEIIGTPNVYNLIKEEIKPLPTLDFQLGFENNSGYVTTNWKLVRKNLSTSFMLNPIDEDTFKSQWHDFRSETGSLRLYIHSDGEINIGGVTYPKVHLLVFLSIKCSDKPELQNVFCFLDRTNEQERNSRPLSKTAHQFLSDVLSNHMTQNQDFKNKFSDWISHTDSVLKSNILTAMTKQMEYENLELMRAIKKMDHLD